MNRKILMIVGPAEIEPEILLKGAKKQVYNRTPEFSTFMKEINENLKYLFQTKNNVYTFTSSGTGAMEAAITNTMCKGDNIIVIARGQWGLRWVEIAKAYGLKPKVIELGMDERLDIKKLERMTTEKIRGVFTTANETTTGILTNVKAIGRVVKKTKAIFVVDASSSLGADGFKTDEWGCDIVIASSQKALSIPPGLAFMAVSEKAWALVKKSTLPKYYFDLKAYDTNIRRGQTPFTPAISLLYQLSARLKKIKEEKLENIIKRQAFLSKILRTGVKALGIEFTGKNLSNGVTGMIAPKGINARKIVDILRKEHNIEIPPSPGKLEKTVFRVGTFGDLNEYDIIKFLCALELTLDKLGYKVEFGKSVKAAMQVIRSKNGNNYVGCENGE